MRRLSHIPQYLALKTIRFYQMTLSFDHGLLSLFYKDGYCQFYPTCSEYGYTCIERHGVMRGSVYTLWRILRCNPFSKGGIDEPPKKTAPR
ncbi:membrane protein insertion efficiency factor YidD [Candidatus Uhrbacteria bacterium CG_4_9_14_3_um_filter_50_9]|uniref:Putative membrane protein insertion efficiency factor n=1 Tax=Candidatus Uhrbacteria bacterium CG_4_9_14_3_um_filter_50_9 TaxID=1975035 RepID=A0A2M7XCN7_9BACT|nr:MAG: membrane protein insertion efficiency factor YidD [Candidatus Uhrbacteria bacterium CG_4_9_14_3_um_filter_50_9]